MTGSHTCSKTRQIVRTLPWQGFSQVMQAAGALVYPPCCTLCEEAIELEQTPRICLQCRQQIQACWRQRCRRCGMGQATSLAEEDCSLCRGKSLPYQQSVLLGDYKGLLRDAVIMGKHVNGDAVSMMLGQMLAKQIQAELNTKLDWVTFVPSPWRRQLFRATVASALISAAVSRAMNVPSKRLLRCRRYVPKQALRSRKDRVANVQGAFQVVHPSRVVGKRILVVDDVMTTGATLGEVSRQLKAAGASRVFVAATARGTGKT